MSHSAQHKLSAAQPEKDGLAHSIDTLNPRFRDSDSYTQVPRHVLLEVEHFFAVYKDFEEERTKVLGWKDQDAAREIIRSSHQRHLESSAS